MAATEHWTIDVGDDQVAILDIPAAVRARSFLVDVRFVVRCPTDGDARPLHGLTVEFDGRKEWTRAIPTSNPGEIDSLDYQRQVEVAAGAGLRVRAVAKAREAEPVQLRIEALEQA